MVVYAQSTVSHTDTDGMHQCMPRVSDYRDERGKARSQEGVASVLNPEMADDGTDDLSQLLLLISLYICQLDRRSR